MAAVIIEILLALAFLGAGFSKISGAKMQVESFNSLKLPQWFRVVTGVMQWIGVAALIIGLWQDSVAAWAGIWFGIIMLCAIGFHLRAKHSIGQMVPAFVLMVLAIIVAVLHSSDFGF